MIDDHEVRTVRGTAIIITAKYGNVLDERRDVICGAASGCQEIQKSTKGSSWLLPTNTMEFFQAFGHDDAERHYQDVYHQPHKASLGHEGDF